MSAAALIAKLPDRIRVGPFDLTLVKMTAHETLAKRCVGEFAPRQLQIGIQNDAPAKLDALDTLVHEINHAIFWAYGIYDEDKEERTAAIMATAWVQVYRDNLWLTRWIAEAVGDQGSGIRNQGSSGHLAQDASALGLLVHGGGIGGT